MRNHIIKAVSLLIGLFFAFIIGEVLLRLLVPNLPSLSWGYYLFGKIEKVNLRIMKPNYEEFGISENSGPISYFSNNWGYRDSKDYSIEKKNGKKRILVLGDSFGWGWGCHFDSSLVRILELKLGENFEVLNFSIPGDGFYRLYQRAEFYGPLLNADHIVVLNYINDYFNTENDIEAINKIANKGDFNPDQDHADIFYDKKLLDYLNDFYVFRLMNNMRFLGRWSAQDEERIKESIYRGYADDKAFGDSDLISEELLLKMFLNKCKELNAPITWVYIPPKYNFDVDFLDKKLVPVFKEKESDFRIEDIRSHSSRMLSIVSSFEQIELLDLSTSLKMSSKLYFEWDAHLNEKGERVVADIIYNSILNEN